MATTLTSRIPSDWSAADLQDHLGGIPLARIRMVPPPGMATVRDVVEAQARTDRICELVDGVLVEKAMGLYESLVAGIVIRLLGDYAESNDLGIVLGEAGTMKILPDQVRIPDVSFIGWSHFPDRVVPREPIPELVPDLAVEVLSKSNTPGEMERKLRDYFSAGVRLVWYIDPDTRAATAFTSPTQSVSIAEHQALSGGDVLPGFELKLSEVFARAGKRSDQ
jgi:Uma2 family endonuclease